MADPATGAAPPAVSVTGAPVAVVALGAHTSLGGLVAAAAAARANLNAAAELGFEERGLAPDLCPGATGHPIAGVDVAARGVGRLLALARPALEDLAVALAAREHRLWGRTGLFLGLPAPRAGEAALEAEPWGALVGATFGATPGSVTLFGAGRAGTLHALFSAATELGAGRLDHAFVIGCESKLDPARLADLAAEGRLKSEEYPVGLFPGEAASCALLESVAHEGAAKGALRLDTLALALEPASRRAGGPAIGRALGAAALGALGSEKDAPLAAYVDLNGEAYRANDWGMALVRLRNAACGELRHVEYPALAFGDVGAAYPLLAAGMAARAFERGYARAERVLVCASADAGTYGVLRLSRART